MLYFLEGSVQVQPFVPFLLLVCSFFDLIVTFWCFVLLCSDLKVVFKRIIYPVLSQFGYRGLFS